MEDVDEVAEVVKMYEEGQLVGIPVISRFLVLQTKPHAFPSAPAHHEQDHWHSEEGGRCPRRPVAESFERTGAANAAHQNGPEVVFSSFRRRAAQVARTIVIDTGI